MGVKGLQSFMERCCPEACVTVNLREMARQHVAKSPTIVVDGMACLRHWYKCRDWVCGGQWGEYMDVLKSWVEAFTSAGIRLVFFFDGLVTEHKRREWVKRRHRVNREISKIFRHMKAHGEQPGRELFCLPSGLATFTGFALRSLGQEVFCSVQEADYEIASYAYQNCSMGILSQDTDFIVYDSAPYLSVAKLQIDSLTTVLYDRQRLCCSIGLAVAQLPLLACLLGNDVVSQEQMQHIRNKALSTYRCLSFTLGFAPIKNTGLIPACLNLSASQREILKSGISSYLLPRQEGVQHGDKSALSTVPCATLPYCVIHCGFPQACREKHVAVDGFMVYCVLWEGVVECSNTLEDEDDVELLPQALVYRPCRQLIYGLLLLNGHHAVREWFVYPGNPLQEPDIVHSVPVNLPCDKPSLDLLWLGSGPDVASLRLKSFLSIFDCLDFLELHGTIEDSLFAALCLVTYIALQVLSSFFVSLIVFSKY
uniref:XPG N-terminal domain-containing protein n=1 Tax=Mola mola TaxID=94237 RepID=A0A3Q3WXK8_MOLML